MLTITPAQLRTLAEQPDTLGALILTLALPFGQEHERLDIKPLGGWRRCNPGGMARDRYGDRPMVGITDDDGTVVLTIVEQDAETEEGDLSYHVEGDDWGIETEGRFGGWMPSGFFVVRPDRGGAIAGSWPDESHRDPREGGPVDPSAQPRRDDPMPYIPGVSMTLWTEACERNKTYGMKPAWTKRGYDWKDHLKDAGNTISRLYRLSQSCGVKVGAVAYDPRPTHSLMVLIEKSMGLATVEHPAQPHKLLLGERITRAETAAAAVAEREDALPLD